MCVIFEKRLLFHRFSDAVLTVLLLSILVGVRMGREASDAVSDRRVVARDCMEDGADMEVQMECVY